MSKKDDYINWASKISMACAICSVVSVIAGIISCFIEIRLAMVCFMVLFYFALVGLACDFYVQGAKLNTKERSKNDKTKSKKRG